MENNVSPARAAIRSEFDLLLRTDSYGSALHPDSEATLAKLTRTTGTKGVFTKEIDQALIKGAIDIAVHSLKDLPTEIHRSLAIAAYPERGDPRDAIIGFPLKEMPEGSKVGTGSLRRISQLRRLRPDVQVLEIRGNVDTRLKKLETKKYDALVLAAAGESALHLDPYLPGRRVDAAVVHTDHVEYATISPADLPGVRVVLDGRDVLDQALWAGTAVVRLGRGG